MLARYSRRKACYYCGSTQNINKEHVPPRYLFRLFDCDSITVPSCPEHNLDKNNIDQAIINGMLLSLDQALKSKNYNPLVPVSNRTIQIIEAARPNFHRSKRLITLSHILNKPIRGIANDLAYIRIDPGNWMKQITAGLIWSVIGKYNKSILLDNAYTWSPDFYNKTENEGFEIEEFKKDRDQKMKRIDWLNTLDWKMGWSSTPNKYPADIYMFQVATFERGKSDIGLGFKHIFFSRMIWYVFPVVPIKIANKILEFSTRFNR